MERATVPSDPGETVASHTFDYQVDRSPAFADGQAFVRTLEYDHSADRTRHVAGPDPPA